MCTKKHLTQRNKSQMGQKSKKKVVGLVKDLSDYSSRCNISQYIKLSNDNAGKNV